VPTAPKIRAHYQGTIAGQLRYVPALNRGSRFSIAFAVAALVLAVLSLPYVYLTVFGIALAALVASGYYLVPFAWWTMRRNRWLYEAPVDLAVSDDGLEFTTAAGVRRVPWGAVSRVRELRDVFAVMLRPTGGYCIPKSALEDDDLSDFRELVAANVPLLER
jgi:hypothetical protein